MKKRNKLRVVQPIDPAKLKGYVARIEAVEEEQATLKESKADIYTEVKASGLAPKTVRALIRKRAKKEEDAAELAELERYEAALALAVGLVRIEGLSLRDAARKTGASKSSIHRALTVPEVSQTANGTTERAPLPTNNRVNPDKVAQSQTDHRDAAPQGDPCPPVAPQTEGTDIPPSQPDPEGGEGTGTHSETRSPDTRTSDSTEPVVPTGNEGMAGGRLPDGDGLDIPPFLKREKVAA